MGMKSQKYGRNSVPAHLYHLCDAVCRVRLWRLCDVVCRRDTQRQRQLHVSGRRTTEYNPRSNDSRRLRTRSVFTYLSSSSSSEHDYVIDVAAGAAG